MTKEMKNLLYEQFARIGKAMSNPRRLELLDLLTQGEKTVEMLMEQSRMGIKNTSAQLRELKLAHLVTSRKAGKYVYYKIANEAVLNFFISLRQLAEGQFAEIQKVVNEYLTGSDNFIPTDRGKLLEQVQKGEVIIIDVRPEDEYKTGHLPFARSVPLCELKKQIKSIPKSKKIIAYCRGPYCFLSIDAVDFLRNNGYDAYRIQDGVAEWKMAGFPIETDFIKIAPETGV